MLVVLVKVCLKMKVLWHAETIDKTGIHNLGKHMVNAKSLNNNH